MERVPDVSDLLVRARELALDPRERLGDPLEESERSFVHVERVVVSPAIVLRRGRTLSARAPAATGASLRTAGFEAAPPGRNNAAV